jgi:hypothetical protein
MRKIGDKIEADGKTFYVVYTGEAQSATRAQGLEQREKLWVWPIVSRVFQSNPHRDWTQSDILQSVKRKQPKGQRLVDRHMINSAIQYEVRRDRIMKTGTVKVIRKAGGKQLSTYRWVVSS